MRRSVIFTGDDDREVSVSEVVNYSGVELRVGGLTVVLRPDAWRDFAKLAAATLERYGTPPILVDLGRVCAICRGEGVPPAGEDSEDYPVCPSCEGRGFMPGLPDPPKGARS